MTSVLRSAVLSLVATANALASVACGSSAAVVDAGSPAVDAGSSPCDSGNGLPIDAGGTIVDAGSPVADAGSSGPPVVVTLALGYFIPNGMAIGGNEVFWTGGGFPGDGGVNPPPGIWEVSVDGGPITVLATIPPPRTSASAFPVAVALDATNVYWTVAYISNDGGFQTNILKTPRGGGPTTVLLTGQHVNTGLAVDETSIYWGNAEESAVMKMPLNGGAATTLASGLTLSPSGPEVGWGQTIAVDSTSVYWTSTGSIMKVPLACGMPISLAQAVGAAWIAVAARGVYWTESGTLLTVGLGGGGVTTIASYDAGGNGGPVAVDATNVYWSYFDPSCVGTSCVVIARAPLVGGPSTPLVSGLSGFPTALAVDATSVYWTAQGPYCGGQGCTAVQKVTPK